MSKKSTDESFLAKVQQDAKASLGNSGRSSKIGHLARILEEHDIDIDEIGSVEKIRFYQQGYKDNDGVGHVQTLAALQIDPAWKTGPQWPVVQQASARPVKLFKPSAGVARDGWQSALVLPDMQIGFFQNAAGQLMPTHDPHALEIVRQLAHYVNPNQVVMHGDNLDLPEFSKYRLTPSFQRTTQASIDAYAEFGFGMRSVAPNAVFKSLAGNHEERLPNYILDNARAAYGLKQARQTPESWPVLSVPFLARMDEWGCEFIPGYPANDLWINERIRVIHGNKVRSNGPTAHLYLENARHSTLFGHVHRREWQERVITTSNGPRTILSASAGCLCRTDGAVPSTKAGNDLNGDPMVSYEDWQQGAMVVNYQPGDGPFYIEHVPIHDGVAYYRDREFHG